MAAINKLAADGSDRELIDQITGLERIKSACAAAQARFTYAFTLSQQADGAARKVQPTAPGAASPRRSRWPAGTPGSAGSNTSASPTPWYWICRTP